MLCVASVSSLLSLCLKIRRTCWTRKRLLSTLPSINAHVESEQSGKYGGQGKCNYDLANTIVTVFNAMFDSQELG
jgi:hypothetical protein